LRCTPHARPPRTQGGTTLILVLAGLVLGSVAYYLHSLSRSALVAQREQLTRQALAEAKEALIAWAAEYATQGPGHLPCPDTNGDGLREPVACGTFNTVIGELPWRSLGVPDLRDASGTRLWYAVSPNFVDREDRAVNADTQGILSLRGDIAADGIVALIFAPGPELPGQDRASVQAANVPIAVKRTHYLEGHDFDQGRFVIERGNEQRNDTVAVITAGELFPAVERRIKETMGLQLRKFLDWYAEKWSAHYGGRPVLPYPAAFDPNTLDHCGQPTLTEGMLPLGTCGHLLDWTYELDLASPPGAHASLEAAQCEQIDHAGKQPKTAAVQLKPGALSVLRCTATIRYGTDEGTGAYEVALRLRATLRHARSALSLPVAGTDVSISPAPQHQAFAFTLSGDTDIGIDLTATYSVHEGSGTSGATGVVLEIPVYAAKEKYVAEKSGQADWDKDDPTWIFRNEWQRVVYYAVSPSHLPNAGPGGCVVRDDCLRLIARHAETRQYETNSRVQALLILTGHGLPGRPRPSNEAGAYLEAENAAVGSPDFRQADVSLQFNDRVIALWP